MISPSTPDFPGNWAHCKAGEKPPLGAIQAPDKFTSFVCLWLEKDFTLGRGSDGLHTTGLNAWFPYGGGEWSAENSNIRFDMLVDNGKTGKTGGVYTWTKVSRLTQLKDYKPFIVHGHSPMIINNILGKGSVDHLTGWTCESGREHAHDKEAVLSALVLCIKQIRPNSENGWREVHVHEPARITDRLYQTHCVAKTSQTFTNENTLKPAMMQVKLAYNSEEGQTWKSADTEECDIITVIKSENAIRKLAEAQLPLGLAMYRTDRQTVVIEEKELVRIYEVQPRSKMTVTLSVYKQDILLECPAMEQIYTQTGKLILKRIINGLWRAVSTNGVKAEIEETLLPKED